MAGDWPSAEIWTAFIGDAIWTRQDTGGESEKKHRPPPTPLGKQNKNSAKKEKKKVEDKTIKWQNKLINFNIFFEKKTEVKAK